MDELLLADGEEFIQLTPARQKSRASWLLDTKFVAAVEKSRWGADQRWGYSIVGLNNDRNVIAKLHAKSAEPTASRPPTIDLAGEEGLSSSSGKSVTTHGKPTTKKSKRSHLPPPSADSSSEEEEDIDSDNCADADDNDSDDDEYQPPDASSASEDNSDSDNGGSVDADDSE